MGRPAKDFTGQTFGKLTVLKRIGSTKYGPLWECLCACGQTVNISAGSLTKGHSRSCGCLRSELTSARMTRHGKTDTDAFKSWSSMRSRCNRPKNTAYKDYGGRGIKVCERWNDFENFLADMGERPLGASIERINNDLGYEPGNCRWASQKQQMNNTRRNVFFTYQGKTQTIPQWAEEYGLDRKILWYRLQDRKWPIEKALTTPTKQGD